MYRSSVYKTDFCFINAYVLNIISRTSFVLYRCITNKYKMTKTVGWYKKLTCKAQYFNEYFLKLSERNKKGNLAANICYSNI